MPIKFLLKKFNYPIIEDPKRCAYCGQSYFQDSSFCHKCGEGNINLNNNPNILSLFMDLIGEIWAFVNIRVFNTLLWMLVPGKLTKAHNLGIKNNILKPLTVVTIFVGTFFVFYGNVTLLHADYDELNQGYRKGGVNISNPIHYDVASAVTMKGEKLNLSNEMVITKMKTNAENWSKIFYWIIWVLLAFSFWLVMRGTEPHYRLHSIFSANLFGGYLAIWLLVSFVYLTLKQQQEIPYPIPIIIDILFSIYIFISVKKVYKFKNNVTFFARGIIITILFFAIINLYRQMVSLLSLWLINS